MRALLLLAAGAHANPCDIYDAAPEKTPCVAAHSEFAPASNRGSGSAAVLQRRALAAVAALPTFEPMYGSDTSRTRQPPREQRLPAIGLADVEPRGPRGDAPEQRRREAEHQDVNNLVRLQEKYQRSRRRHDYCTG